MLWAAQGILGRLYLGEPKLTFITPLCLRSSCAESWVLWLMAVVLAVPKRLRSQRAILSGILDTLASVIAEALRTELLPLQEAVLMLGTLEDADLAAIDQDARFLAGGRDKIHNLFWAHGHKGVRLP